ncbi:hypothetical protein QOZ88_05475 [Blastococcus sp. BMG 814]|uniref:Uncharacterized protein n=1 Tax=Blastococcus carthaginiensis TaxID=3050034 RepID=A0ABT9IAE7_9ACTN|nr:hypothetical protein [Blastococcus carthaginiensis]MDP5182080.1 hypothetical protein [Blastococcus carthaginiensis]
MPSADDDARWAEAQRVLDGLPSEALEARVRRWRWLTILLVVGLLLLSVAFAFAVAAWAGDEPPATEDEPLWREIAALAVAASALVLVAVGSIVQWRVTRRLGGLRSPLTVLDRRQRKLLLQELRGTVPVEPEHVPLVRHLAERLAAQQWLLIFQLGLLLMFVGQFIGSPSAWRLGFVVVFGLGIAVVAPLVRRDERQARRFLAEHPDPRVAS